VYIKQNKRIHKIALVGTAKVYIETMWKLWHSETCVLKMALVT